MSAARMQYSRRPIDMTVSRIAVTAALLLAACLDVTSLDTPKFPPWDGNISHCYPENPFGYAPLPPDFNTTQYSTQRHTCFTTENAPCCTEDKSLWQDPKCRGARGHSRDTWLSPNCDYAVMTVLAPWFAPKANRNKWIMIPHGICDSSTVELGDWAWAKMKVNLYKIQPCKDISTTCMPPNQTVCDAIHVSWTSPGKPNFGLNDPVVEEVYKRGDKILWVHEFDQDSHDYRAWSAPKCNRNTKPAYWCMLGDDKRWDSKFPRMKKVLEDALSNSKYIPCNVTVIDATKPWVTPFPNHNEVPCSGVFPPGGSTNVGWEASDAIWYGVKNAIYYEQLLPQSKTLDAIVKAIQIALE